MLTYVVLVKLLYQQFKSFLEFRKVVVVLKQVWCVIQSSIKQKRYILKYIWKLYPEYDTKLSNTVELNIRYYLSSGLIRKVIWKFDDFTLSSNNNISTCIKG